MDGKLLIRELKDLLNESSNSGWFSEFTAYQYLYQAAVEFTMRTKCLRSTQAITTEASQSDYTLNADFLDFFMREDDNRRFIKLNDGSTDYFIPFRDYEDVFYGNNTTAQPVPDYFTITDVPSLSARITGTASLAGATSGGECTLTDTSSSTKFANVSAWDIVHNTTDGSDGIVLSKTSDTALVAALFEGTANDWTLGDSYVIQPQGRYKIVVDPPTSAAGYTITVPYVTRPAPVFSDYGMYKFPSQYSSALVKYAFWLYKYRDGEPSFGDAMYVFFDNQCRLFGSSVTKSLREKRQISVNFRARR